MGDEAQGRIRSPESWVITSREQGRENLTMWIRYAFYWKRSILILLVTAVAVGCEKSTDECRRFPHATQCVGVVLLGGVCGRSADTAFVG